MGLRSLSFDLRPNFGGGNEDNGDLFQKVSGKNTEELYKNSLHNPYNHNDVITHLEPESWKQSQVGLRKHHYEQS